MGPAFMYDYLILGLPVKSELLLHEIAQASAFQNDDTEAAVIIIQGNVPQTLSNAMEPYRGVYVTQREMLATIPGVGAYFVQNGERIIVQPEPGASDEMVHLYLLGLCFGAILHQRGILPLHASCLYADGGALMILGTSGAGKSTASSVLMNRGWLLMSDDITPVLTDDDGMIRVVSGYSTQKIWESNTARIPEDKKKFFLYSEEDRRKYTVDESERFYEGTAPLRLIVHLSVNAEYDSEPQQGALADIHRLMANTYRSVSIIDEAAKKRQFQTCADIARNTPSLIIRRGPKESAEAIAEKIIARWEDLKN